RSRKSRDGRKARAPPRGDSHEPARSLLLPEEDIRGAHAGGDENQKQDQQAGHGGGAAHYQVVDGTVWSRQYLIENQYHNREEHGHTDNQPDVPVHQSYFSTIICLRSKPAHFRTARTSSTISRKPQM